jgi:septal ring factor EnvC (AmiA/AmiB activator)
MEASIHLTACVLPPSKRHSWGDHIFVLLQKLEEKAEQIRTVVAEHETKLATEINQRKQMELRIASQAKEMETLVAETVQLNETLKAVRKKNQGKKYCNISAYFSNIKIRKYNRIF